MKKLVTSIAIALSILTITGCERGWIRTLVAGDEDNQGTNPSNPNEGEIIVGCMDGGNSEINSDEITACNYNPDANQNDWDSCWYPPGYCSCDDGEDAWVDECGVCFGPDTNGDQRCQTDLDIAWDIILSSDDLTDQYYYDSNNYENSFIANLDWGVPNNLHWENENIWRMRELLISYSDLDTLPITFTGLIGLNTLRLRNNDFTEFPELLYSMNSLREIDLTGNFITSIDESICESNLNLYDLNLSNNSLKSIPNCICSNVMSLHLNSNQICNEYNYECVQNYNQSDGCCDGPNGEDDYTLCETDLVVKLGNMSTTSADLQVYSINNDISGVSGFQFDAYSLSNGETSPLTNLSATIHEGAYNLTISNGETTVLAIGYGGEYVDPTYFYYDGAFYTYNIATINFDNNVPNDICIENVQFIDATGNTLTVANNSGCY